MSKYFLPLFIGSASLILSTNLVLARIPARNTAQVPAQNTDQVPARNSDQIPAQVREQIPARNPDQIPNIEGDWKMSIQGENRATSISLVQKGNAFTGTFRGGQMGDLPITGTVTNDNKVDFTGKFMLGSLNFSGTVDGKTMKGKVDLPMGREGTDWTATK
jgi:hypothetical protein